MCESFNLHISFFNLMSKQCCKLYNLLVIIVILTNKLSNLIEINLKISRNE